MRLGAGPPYLWPLRFVSAGGAASLIGCSLLGFESGSSVTTLPRKSNISLLTILRKSRVFSFSSFTSGVLMPLTQDWPCMAGSAHATPQKQKIYCKKRALPGADLCLGCLEAGQLVLCAVRCCAAGARGLFCLAHQGELEKAHALGLGVGKERKARIVAWLGFRENSHALRVAALEDGEPWGKRGAVDLVGAGLLLASSVLLWLAFLSGLVIAVGKVDLLSGIGGFAIFCACLLGLVVWVGSRRFARRSGWVELVLSASLLICLVGAVLSFSAIVGGNDGGFIAGPLFCLGVGGFSAAPFVGVKK